MRWESRITEYAEGEHFADEMLSGPYRRWYHHHHFRAVPGGVEISDSVEYQMPFGVLGRLAHALFVRRQLETIFTYREAQVARLFPLHIPSPVRTSVMP
jgi:ligand-binding SRPBCC domain-containing protein